MDHRISPKVWRLEDKISSIDEWVSKKTDVFPWTLVIFMSLRVITFLHILNIYGVQLSIFFELNFVFCIWHFSSNFNGYYFIYIGEYSRLCTISLLLQTFQLFFLGFSAIHYVIWSSYLKMACVASFNNIKYYINLTTYLSNAHTNVH